VLAIHIEHAPQRGGYPNTEKTNDSRKNFLGFIADRYMSEKVFICEQPVEEELAVRVLHPLPNDIRTFDREF